MAVITIARQFGAGGKTLGGRVAEELGYFFIDTELITRVARKAKVTTDWVESIEKEAGNSLMNFIAGLVTKNFLNRILDESKGYIDEDIYIDKLYEVIEQLAKEGDCVIMGRGGQYILSNHENMIHLLLIGKFEDRIAFMEKNYHLSTIDARNSVITQDKKRLNLYRKFKKQDYDQPELYDIVLNMSRLNMEEAVKIVCGLVSHA